MTNLCVYGLWHLGSVTAGCMAEHFPTVGLDPDPAVVDGLRDGRPPILEPGLEDLIRQGLARRSAGVHARTWRAWPTADVVWVTFDTPVDEDDRADVESVVRHVERLFPHLADGAVVLLSSQMPVGTTARLEAAVRGGRRRPSRRVRLLSREPAAGEGDRGVSPGRPDRRRHAHARGARAHSSSFWRRSGDRSCG